MTKRSGRSPKSWEVKATPLKELNDREEILTKIVFYNLLPKSGEYSHTRGSAPLLIYCLLKGIRVNISKLIIDFMASEYLLSPNRYLLYGMLITRLLKQLKFDLSAERFIEPFVESTALS